jgi:hypothetical protein
MKKKLQVMNSWHILDYVAIQIKYISKMYCWCFMGITHIMLYMLMLKLAMLTLKFAKWARRYDRY